MIYVISKATFGSYNVRDIQCNANWDCCPYSDYALIPDSLVEGILATKGYCDIVLTEDGNEVASFTARTIPSVEEECCGSNTVLFVNGVKANTDGELTLRASDVGAAPSGLHRCYGSLKDIGITAFPTTMSVVANAMPANSMIVIDTRTIMTGGAEEISDWGNTSNGTAYINKGSSIARVTMAVIYGSGSAVKGRLFVGSWANSTNTVGWCDYGFDGNASYPGCFYRSVDGVIEWINPPMVLGVEYRTTERCDGKVVYAKNISCGTIPASGRAVTAHSLNSRIIRYAGSVSTKSSLPYRDPLASNGVGNGTMDLAVSGNNITINTNMTDGKSPGTACVQLWYVKD